MTLDQNRAIQHDDPDDTVPVTLASASLVTLTATINDGDVDEASDTANIGGALAFNDAQPTITGQHEAPAEAQEVQFVDNATGSGTFTADFNNDEPGTVVISDVNYTGPLTMTFDSDTINFHDGDTLVYHLDLTSTGYTVTVDDAPEGGTVSSPLDFGALQSGRPQEFLDVTTVTGETTIRFDGVLFTGAVDDANVGDSSTTLTDDFQDREGGGAFGRGRTTSTPTTSASASSRGSPRNSTTTRASSSTRAIRTRN